jgi:hypothetical protein
MVFMNRLAPYLFAACMVAGLMFAAGAATAVLTPSPAVIDPVEEPDRHMADDVILLSDYSNLSSGSIKGRLGRERKDGTRGRARMTIEIRSEPLTCQFDETQLGHGPAEAAAEVLREKVQAITEKVSPTTAETRQYQEAAYNREGKRTRRHRGEAKSSDGSWAKKRFGFRGMENVTFDQGLRKFNHSGTFAKSIVARENKTDKTWTVNVAANRLDPRTSGGAAEFAFITDALRRLVPEIDDPARLLADPRVAAAVDQAIESLILDKPRYNALLKSRLWRERLGAFGVRLPGSVQSFVFGPA